MRDKLFFGIIGEGFKLFIIDNHSDERDKYVVDIMSTIIETSYEEIQNSLKTTMDKERVHSKEGCKVSKNQLWGSISTLIDGP